MSLSVPKIADFGNYNKYPTDAKPTTDAEMQDFLGNQNAVLQALGNLLWQPQTEYQAGAIVHSPNMTAGLVAVCIKTGVSGTTEPNWTAQGTAVTDNYATWEMRLASAANATSSSEGLMSAADKKKLDGIDANANKYTLPAAGANKLGGVIVGTGLSVDANGKISAKADLTLQTQVVVPGGLQAWSGDAKAANGAGSVLTLKQGIESGTYTLMEILTKLVSISHDHGRGKFGNAGSVCRANCDCNCNCGDDGGE